MRNAGRDPHSSIVRLWTPDGEVAGLGVLLDRQRVLTCAHVVNVALGLANRYETDIPAGSQLISLDFPFLAGASGYRATLVEGAWDPPPTHFGGSGRDVAVVQLRSGTGATPPYEMAAEALPPFVDAPVDAQPAVFSWDPGPRKGSLWVFGYPGKPPRSEGMPVDLAVWGKLPGGRIVVQSTTDQTVKAQPGYSGSPVWRDDPPEVVGLLHAAPPAEAVERDAYVMPTESVADAWPPFAAVATPANPYRALAPFTVEDSDAFHGREAETDALHRAVLTRTVTIVTGASGVGKSSLVQAGLLPRLRADVVSGRWLVAQFRPGQLPLLQLATALAKTEREVTGAVGAPSVREAQDKIDQLLADGLQPTFEYFRGLGHELLIFADQFEEVLAASEADRTSLLDLLLTVDAVEHSSPATRLVMTVRSDVLLELQDVPGMGSRLAGRLMPLSPLTADAVSSAVAQPALDLGVDFEPGLVDQIVRDAGTPVSLPLLEFTLHELWNSQDRRTLTRTSYLALGSVGGALDRYADRVIATLDEPSRVVADRILLRMVRTISADRHLVTRQRVPREDLAGQELIIARLVDSRLVDADHDHLELAHEVLITAWGRLRRLVEDNARFLAWKETMRGRTMEDLLPESRLLEAEQWLSSRPADIATVEVALIRASRAALDDRAAERARAEMASRERERALEVAESLRLGTEALDTAQSEPEVALLVAWEALLLDRNEYSENVFRDLLGRIPADTTTLVHAGEDVSVGFLAGGVHFAASALGEIWFGRTGSSVHPVRVWLPGEGELVAAPAADGTLLLVYRDGLLAAYDPAAVLADSPVDPGCLEQLRLAPARSEAHAQSLETDLSVSKGSRCLVRDGDVGWLVDLDTPWSVVSEFRFAADDPVPEGELDRLMADDPERLRQLWEENATWHHEDRLFHAVLDPTGQFVLTEAGSSARVFPLDHTPPVVLQENVGVRSSCVLADGAIVLGSMHGGGAIWNRDGTCRRVFREETEGFDLVVLAVDRARTRFATALGSGGGVDLRDQTGDLLQTVAAPKEEQFRAGAFCVDGTKLALGSREGTVLVAPTDGSSDPIVLSGHAAPVCDVCFHPDDPQVLLSADQRGEVRCWRLEPPGPADLVAGQRSVRQIRALPSSAMLVSDDSHTARVWTSEAECLDLGGRLLDLVGPTGSGPACLLTEDAPDGVRVWSVDSTPVEVALLRWSHASDEGPPVLGPDGTHVLRTARDLQVLQSVATGATIPLHRAGATQIDPGHEERVGAGFRADGSRVVVAAVNGGAWIWAIDGTLIGSFVTDHGSPDRTFDLACDPLGEFIATAVRNEVGLWSWEGQKINSLGVAGYKVWSVRWSPDGERVVAVSSGPGGDCVDLCGRDGSRCEDLGWISPGGPDTTNFDRHSRYWTIRSGPSLAVVGRDGERLGLLSRPRGAYLLGRGALSPDGELVAASFSDGTALIWSWAEQRRVMTLRIGDHTLIGFGTDGRTLLVGRPTGAISRFALRIDDLFPSAARRVTRTLTDVELDRLGLGNRRLTAEQLRRFRAER